MKRITLMVLAAVFALTASWAQQRPKREVRLSAATTQQMLPVSVGQMKKENTQRQRQGATAKDSRALLSLSQHCVTYRAPWQQGMQRLASKSPVTEQPAGEYVLYSRSGQAYASTLFGIMYTEFENKVAEAVFAEDNVVYVKNIISQYDLNTWFKGTIDGSTITFDLPLQVDIQGYTYYVMMMKLDYTQATYVPNNETTLVLNYDAETGAFSTPDGDLATGDLVVGLATGDGEWTGLADWNIQLKKVSDEPLAAPEGLETTDYAVTAEGFAGTIVKVGFSNDDIYVQGLCPEIPEGWLKGTVSGNKVVFKNGQYLGADLVNGYFQYVVSATASEVYYPDYDYYDTVYELIDQDIVFDYDPANRILYGGSTFLINAGTSSVLYSAVLANATMKPFIEKAATPAMPTDLYLYEGGYDYYSYGYGWGYIEFNLNCADVNGDYILPEKMSYAIYTRVNGEERVLELSAYDYLYQSEPLMTEIPYFYTDNWDVNCSGINHYLYYYVIGPEAFGVQTIYRGSGEERRSEIAWVDVQGFGKEVQPVAATPDYPDIDPADTGSSVAFGPYTGNENRSYFGDWTPQTYDVAMFIGNKDLAGTHIESITFPLISIKGIKDVKVWVSSQLRVENNQNIPDLLSVDVTPQKTGNVTVKLDKPYIIPAGGVYVGYTFTVDGTYASQQSGPVRTVEGAKPTGFYLHTSRGFLKWLELSETIGASALMEVSVGGSKVKANAVTPVSGETTFLMTNKEYKLNFDFVNHGAEGIKTMDVEYTLNGQTIAQHYDISKRPVKGFFGVTCTASFTPPVVSEKGNYDLKVKVVKVNDVENEDAQTEAVTQLVLLNTVPKHRALLEEYTGTWCGWCPRGFVALEKLAELYPDEYVTVSYHNSDPMEILASNSFPSPVSGFPAAWIDRGMEVDPYYGSSNTGMGVLDDLKWRSSMFAAAGIDLKARLSDDENKVDVTASVTFPYSDDEITYALEYILVADGLTGEGSDWDQSNYFSGNSDYSGDKNLSAFFKGESSVSGLVFNDVAVMMSDIGGIEGSLPVKVTADVPVVHNYTFDLIYAWNTSYQNIIQDKSKLEVVALLVNTKTGEVANARKVAVTTGSEGISMANADASTVTSVQIFDLGGCQLSTMRRGTNIVRISYANGTCRTIKVVK